MKTLKIVFLLFSVLLSVLFSAAQAQTDPQNGFKEDPVKDIRIEAEEATKRNQELTQQYQSLYSRQIELQKKIDEQKRLLTDLDEKERTVRDLRKEEKTKINEFYKELDRTRNQNEVQEAKYLVLKKDFLDIEEQVRLSRMEVADLQFQRRKGDLDLKKEQVKCDARKEKDESAARSLREQINSAQETELKFLKAMNDLEAGGQQRDQAQQDIEDLYKVQQHLLKQNDYYDQQKSLLTKKEEYFTKFYAHQLQEQEPKKQGIQNLVKELEKEYVDLREAVRRAVEAQGRKKELMRGVMDLEKQNQVLRDRIADYKARLQKK